MAAPAKTPAKKSYRALTPILCDGERYAIGDAVPLTAKQAKRLKDQGAIGNAVKANPATPPAE